MWKLLDYWPEYLQELYEFYVLAGVWQPSADQMWDDLRSMTDDFYLTTLTERGCARWEKMLGIIPAPGDTVENRRKEILLKTMSRRPYTRWTLQNYLESVLGDVQLTIDYREYTVSIETGSENEQILASLHDQLRQMIPANMTLFLAIMAEQIAQLYSGCLLQDCFDHFHR